MGKKPTSLFRKVRRFILVLIALPLLYLGGVMIYGTVTDYQPGPFESLKLEGKGSKLDQDTLRLLTWNIGYAGQGTEMDFFYDGGTQVRVTEAQHQTYYQGIQQQLVSMDSVDFFLLQEVDSMARRSYFQNEIFDLGKALPNYTFAFGKNYDCPFVPKPFLNPLGSVVSGLVTYARYQPDSASRYAYPGNFGWPKRVFLLDRCFMVFRYKLDSGKELVLINNHNSAFDDGELKQKQMEMLKGYCLAEFEKGNYVIVGGDWNQCPPFFPAWSLSPVKEGEWKPLNMDPTIFPEEWRWLYDPIIPTQRSMNLPYDGQHNFRTIIDYFLISPNVEAIRVKGIHQEFAFSDHQPVLLTLRLKP